MARTTLTRTDVPLPYASAGAAVTMTAADVANGNQCLANKPALLIAQNGGGAPYTVTVTSAADAHGRTKDITTEAIAAGAIRVYNLLEQPGWVQSDGYFYFAASNAAVLFGILALP